MKELPRIGTVGERRFVVEEAHAVRLGPEGMPPVLSTPWLTWFLEGAALDAALPFLEPGEITVGAHLEMDHLAPSPVGASVVCRARVVHREGKVISYQIEATDEHEPIARGFHRRRVVSADRLAARVRQKSGKASGGASAP
jgi:fluoroacetyl-CoA thioesterase